MSLLPKDRRLVLALAAILLVVFLIRARLASMPLERDEGEYAYVGQLLLEGIPPYKMVYVMKFLGTHVAYACLMKCFGQTDTAIRWGLILINLLTAATLGALASTLATQGRGGRLTFTATTDGAQPGATVPHREFPNVGWWAACVFAVLSAAPSMLGITANAEHFVILPAVVGFLLLVRKTGLFYRFAAGIYLGLALCMKQQAIFFVVAGFLWILFSGPRPYKPVPILCSWLLYAAGVAVALGLMVFYVAAMDALRPFQFWCFTYPSHYGSMWTLADGARHFASQFFPVVRDHFLIAAAVVLGLIVSWRSSRQTFWMSAVLLAAGFAATAPGLIFRPHYFLFITPGVAIAAAFGLASLGRWKPVGLAALALPLLLRHDVLFALDPETACRRLYPRNAFVETRRIGLDLKTKTHPLEAIGVLGSEPQIAFYAQRRLATPFVYMYPLMEPQPYAAGMQREMIQRLETFPPRYMVHVRLPTSWLAYPQSNPTIADWMPKFLESQYRRVTSIPCRESQEIVIYEAK